MIYKETKTSLIDEPREFNCELLSEIHDPLLLKFVLEDNYKFNGLELPAGSVTIGAFWPNEPCTLYQFYDYTGRLVGSYFNAADQIRITKKQVIWRDLILDVLVLPGGYPQILDADRIPADLDHEMLEKIWDSVQYILDNHEFLSNPVHRYVKDNNIWLFQKYQKGKK